MVLGPGCVRLERWGDGWRGLTAEYPAPALLSHVGGEAGRPQGAGLGSCIHGAPARLALRGQGS